MLVKNVPLCIRYLSCLLHGDEKATKEKINIHNMVILIKMSF